MLTHQGQEQTLIDFKIWTPIVTNYVVGNCLYKLWVQIVMGSLFLKRRIRKRAQSFSVINVKMNVICPKTVYCNQVNYCFLPCVWSRVLEILNRSNIIILNIVKCTFMRHISLSVHVIHRINL